MKSLLLLLILFCLGCSEGELKPTLGYLADTPPPKNEPELETRGAETRHITHNVVYNNVFYDTSARGIYLYDGSSTSEWGG